MAKEGNILETFEVGLKVGATAMLFTASGEILLNQTGLNRGAKAAATTIVGIGGAAILAGFAPKIAAGLFVGAVVTAGLAFSHGMNLEDKVDKAFSALPAPATTTPAGSNTSLPAGTTPATQPGSAPAYYDYARAYR